MSLNLDSKPEDLIRAHNAVREEVEALRAGRDADRAAMQRALDGMNALIARGKQEAYNGPESLIRDCIVSQDEAATVRNLAPGKQILAPTGGNGGTVVLRTCKSEDGDWLPGLLDSPEIRTPWTRELREMVTSTSLFVKHDNGRNGVFARHARRAKRAMKRHLTDCPDALRHVFTPERVDRIFADVATGGAEMIFDLDMPMLAEKMEMEASISALFPMEMVNSHNFRVPKRTRGLTPFKKGVVTTDDPPKYRKSSIATTSETRTLAAIAIAAQYDEDAAEDLTWMDIGQRLQFEAARALVWGREGAILHGDTAGTHQDTLTYNPRDLWDATLLGGSDDHRRLWLGLRAHAKDVSGASGDRSGDANIAVSIRTARGALSAPLGLNDCVVLVSYETFLQKLVALDDFKTLDSYGALATRISANITGPLPNQIGVIDGMPVCIAWQLTADYETSGLYTNGSGAKSAFLVVPRSKWKLYVRRTARIETDKDITTGATDVVLTARELFALDPSVAATDKAAYLGHNI